MTNRPADLLIDDENYAARLAEDLQARKEALDVARSFLVQAPAGSGKTELLTKRVLALLAVVDEPEDILAITFTVAATAEMRNRVMNALAEAQSSIDTEAPSDQHAHAIAALRRSRERGWSLLEQPGRLNIQTIDALCLGIAYGAPLLSRLGGQLQPTEDAQPLYALAARRTLEQLGGTLPQLSEALKTLLRLRDVNLRDCEKLIADMLSARDQWLEEVSIARSLSEEDWLRLRKTLEAPFVREHQYVINRVRSLLQNHTNDIVRLLALIRNACEGAPPTPEIAPIHAMNALDEFLHLEHFECLRKVLLTKTSTWRKAAGSAPGFKPQTQGGLPEHHQEFESILNNISQSGELLKALVQMASLPGLAYTDSEWDTIRSIFTVLLHAVGELRVVFNERGKMDFVEAGLTASWALSDDEIRHNISYKTRHLLVDEFQDTSRKQYELLKSIVREWDPEDHRTCFFVGDPMQSIYLFRHAELALFDEVQQHGFGPDAPGVRFHRLTLSQNFRSIEAVVEPVNDMFNRSRELGRTGAQRFTPAVASSSIGSLGIGSPSNAGRSNDAFMLHARFVDDHAGRSPAAGNAANDKVGPILETIRKYLPYLDEAKARDASYRIGVLVRVKQHVSHIAAALRRENIPFRAIEIETLKDRQEIRDLLSLLRALTQPMDRVAWLAMLRAPWCGLELADLHLLAGNDDPIQLARPMRQLLSDRLALLSQDGQVRVRHLQSVLERSLSVRSAGAYLASPNGFAAWIEETWIALGGEQCIDKTARENVDAFFQLLASLPPWEAAGASLNARLDRLFAAPDPAAQERCSIQLMTIHKAKGLGFDVVLLPELHRKSGGNNPPLFRRLARLQRNSTDRELLIAPIGAKGQHSSATYKWIGKQADRDELDEQHRLFYVACTRARTALHLFADITPKRSKKSIHAERLPDPNPETLLACGWDYLCPDAEQQYLHWRQTSASITQNGLSLVPRISPTPSTLLELAASAEQHTQVSKRLPLNLLPVARISVSAPAEDLALEAYRPRMRHPSMASRARGITLHALFEQLSNLPADDERWNILKNDAHWRTIATALLRNAGLVRREIEVETRSVLSMLTAAAGDPVARWMLSRQASALNEASWTTQNNHELRTVRCDRIFVAGPEPLKDGQDHLWIVDYKTADVDPDSFLLEEQSRYAPQLTLYAEALSKSAEFADQRLSIMLALYYPALQRLQWWTA